MEEIRSILGDWPKAALLFSKQQKENTFSLPLDLNSTTMMVYYIPSKLFKELYPECESALALKITVKNNEIIAEEFVFTENILNKILY